MLADPCNNASLKLKQERSMIPSRANSEHPTVGKKTRCGRLLTRRRQDGFIVTSLATFSKRPHCVRNPVGGRRVSFQAVAPGIATGVRVPSQDALRRWLHSNAPGPHPHESTETGCVPQRSRSLLRDRKSPVRLHPRGCPDEEVRAIR